MADSMKFSKIAKPTSLGTHCWTCNTSAHPEGFVQFNGMHVNAYGTVALCVGCVYELGRVPGMIDPDQAADMDARFDEALEELSVANEQLAYEREHKVVSLTDVLALTKEQKPAAKPKAAA